MECEEYVGLWVGEKWPPVVECFGIIVIVVVVVATVVGDCDVENIFMELEL